MPQYSTSALPPAYTVPQVAHSEEHAEDKYADQAAGKVRGRRLGAASGCWANPGGWEGAGAPRKAGPLLSPDGAPLLLDPRPLMPSNQLN